MSTWEISSASETPIHNCRECGQTLVKRLGYDVEVAGLEGNKCANVEHLAISLYEKVKDAKMGMTQDARMWQLSHRAQEIQASPIRKLVPYADEAKKRGTHVYHLNIGQPDIETPPEFWDAVKNYSQKVLAYGHSQGLASYLKALSGYYQQCGLNIAPDEIVVTTGGSEAIVFAFTLICQPGEKIIVFEPFYTNYNGFATMASVELVPIETHAEDGFHLPPREVIEAAIDDDVRGIIICNPNNPTGTLFSFEEMSMIAEIAQNHGLFVLSDEVYREFVYEGTHTSIFDIPGVDEYAIMLDSISKRYSACGARIGSLVTKNHRLHQAAVKFGQARLCSPTLEQVGAEAALKLGPAYFDKVMGEYRRRRDIVYRGTHGYRGHGLRQAGRGILRHGQAAYLRFRGVRQVHAIQILI